MKKFIASLSVVIFAAIIMTGCGPSEVIVKERPEPPRYSQPLAPGPEYIWVSNEWVVKNGVYEYRKGYWVPVSNKHRHYAEGYWESRKNGWVWISGHWK